MKVLHLNRLKGQQYSLLPSVEEDVTELLQTSIELLLNLNIAYSAVLYVVLRVKATRVAHGCSDKVTSRALALHEPYIWDEQCATYIYTNGASNSSGTQTLGLLT